MFNLNTHTHTRSHSRIPPIHESVFKQRKKLVSGINISVTEFYHIAIFHVYTCIISTYPLASTYKQRNTYISFLLDRSKISNTKELQTLEHIRIGEITLTVTNSIKFLLSTEK